MDTARTSRSVGNRTGQSDQDLHELTLTQKQMFFSQQLVSPSGLYNLTFSYLFPGRMDIAAFKRAFQQLIDETDCLRIQIDTTYPQGKLSIQPDLALDVEVIDFTHAADPELAFEQWITPLAEEPLDLSRMVIRSALALIDENRTHWVVTLHHMVVDGYGMFLLYQRLKTLYAAFAAGEDVPAQQMAPYRALLDANETYIQSPQYSEDEQYWCNSEKNAPGPVYLYGRICRAAPAPARRIEVLLPEGQARRLHEMALLPEFQAKNLNVALFNLMLTAYSVFLSQASGQTDLMVGVPFLNRPGNLRAAPGLAIASVPLHITIDPEGTYTSLCEHIREVSKEAARHSRLPVANPRNSLYNVMFNFHNRSYDDTTERIEHRWFSGCDTFDLVLNVYNPETAAGKVRLAFDFSCETFPEQQQAIAIQHFLRALEALLEDPQRCVMYPCLLTEEERREIIYGHNPVLRPFIGPDVIHLFTEQCQRTPHRIAVESASGSLTYQELDEQSSQLASFLCAEGLGEGHTIGVYLGRSLELAVSILAVWKAGSIYVPLDANYPAARLQHMMTDAAAAAVITSAGISETCPPGAARLLYIDRIPLNEQAQMEPLPARLDEPAYIIYTSGSTGTPKGVIVSHRGFAGYLEAEMTMLQLRAEDRVLYFAAPGFDASFEEIFPTWLAGATLSIRPEGSLSLAEFNQLIYERAITVLSLPAAFWGEWVNGLEQSGDGLPPSLRIVMLYAEEPNIQRYIAWRKLPGANRVRWINTYGPTEAVVTTSIFEPAKEDGDPAGWVHLPIGRPILNHAMYILDSAGLPAPQGVPGEIYIGGDAALGYQNLSAETSERFLRDPFNSARGGVMYRTGDRARMLRNGQFEFLGRVDQQVKLNGFRIELGEIENRLESHPAIRQAVVLMKDAPGGVQRLVAYLTPVSAENDVPSGKELRNFLKTWLPDYMLPAAVMVLPEFPITSNGKINRAALPEPSFELANHAGTEIQSALEAQLVNIWKKILQLEAVGVQEDFFDLGGSSLLCVRMFEEIRSQLGVWLPVAALIEAPTVRELAGYIENHSAGYLPSCAVLMRSGGPERPLFFVHGWGGGIIGYTDLIRCLSRRWPIYGLQAAGTAGEEAPDESIEAMADRYIRAMKSVQAHGPYRVAGYCTGGIIAYAIACRLEEMGETADLVGIIEGPVPHAPQEALPLFSAARLRIIWKSIPFWAKDYRQLGIIGLRQRVLNKLNKLWKRQTKKIGQPQAYEEKDVLLMLDDTTRLPDYQVELLRVQRQAIANFNPGPYQGKVTIFTAFYPTISKGLTGPLDPNLGWKRLVRGEIQQHYVMATHRNLHLPPYCHELAEKLEKDLSEADAALKNNGTLYNLP